MDIENPEFRSFIQCAYRSGLRYLCIGGYAVNYYGYHRATEDLDIWIAPTPENKELFLKTLYCMGYTEQETGEIEQEDFTRHFFCSLGAPPHLIDVLTIVHIDIPFDEAEKTKETILADGGTPLPIVPYHFLKEIKLRAARPKDLWDVAKMEEAQQKK